MYNEEIKTAFIHSYTESETRRDHCKRLFDEFEPYEREWNADLSTRSLEDIAPLIDKLSGIRVSSKYTVTSAIIKYVKWCIKTGAVPNVCKELLNINDLQSSYNFSERMISGPLALQRYLNMVFDAESEHSFDNIYRCYLWFAFMGISSKEAIKIKCSEVDFQNMVIRHNNKEYPVFRESLPCLKNCISLPDFLYKHPLYNKPSYKQRAANDFVLRGYTDRTTARSLYEQTVSKSKANKDRTGKYMNYTTVWLSGIFYHLYVQEQTTGFADFESAAFKYAEEKAKTEPFDKTKLSHTRRLVIIRDMKHDYDKWKTAFSL